MPQQCGERRSAETHSSAEAAALKYHPCRHHTNPRASPAREHAGVTSLRLSIGEGTSTSLLSLPLTHGLRLRYPLIDIHPFSRIEEDLDAVELSGIDQGNQEGLELWGERWVKLAVGGC
mmetsp:Transcript_22342/g.44262  ORF Transcript_22342/g.44262 Transcript_22342/m.44262 type:complete len:119 (+) Transcript_22342:729-1085(+)